MATFKAYVTKLEIEPHPNADALELAKVQDYYVIVPKDQYQTGDLAVYIPEQAILPEWIIKDLGLEGKLSGKQENRVKAVRLRGTLSQGLVYPLEKDVPEKGISNALKFLGDDGRFHHQVVHEGDDVTELLGITKYEPPIPVHMSGEVFNAHNKTISYDIENIQKYPDVFEPGELVEVTEKIHGTWACFGFHPEVGEIVTSKGLSGKGLAFKFNGKNALNVYMRALHKTCPEGTPQAQYDGNIIEQICDLIEQEEPSIPLKKGEPFYLIGEVFGKGVQDLSYGYNDVQFRLFDVYKGFPERGRFLDHGELNMLSDMLDIPRVPVLYEGPFSQDVVDQYTNGTESVSGKNFNIREGIVIKPLEERFDPDLGRVILKSVSEDYLLRKGKTTEYN